MRNYRYIVYALLCLGCVTISFNIAAITAAVPAMSRDLGVTDINASRVISYYLLPYGMGALIYAPLTRFLTYRVAFSSAMTFFGIASLWAGMAQSLELVLYARIGMGIGAAAAIPLGLMLIGELFERNVRGRLVGLFFSSAFVASFAGVVIGGFLHWRWLFYIPALLAFLLVVGCMIFGKAALGHVHKAEIDYLMVLRNRDVFKVFSFIFAVSFLYHAVHKWYGVYLSRAYGMEKEAISFFFALTLIGGFLGQNFGGYLSDKKSRSVTCYIGVFGLSVSVMLLFGIYSHIILGCILLCVSLFWTVGHNGLSTILTDFPEQYRPAIASLNSSIRFISGGVGFYISTFFVEKNFGLTFLGVGVAILLLSATLKIIIPK